MKIVASHLRDEATRRRDVEEKDIFGRSAFNRYYYATYLNVKSGLGKCRPEWGALSHGDIPSVLRGKIRTAVNKGIVKAGKSSDADTVFVCNKALHAIDALAGIMEHGYATRVAADYKPEIRVDFSGGVNFKLNTVEVVMAEEWSKKASGLINTIAAAWRQIDG